MPLQININELEKALSQILEKLRSQEGEIVDVGSLQRCVRRGKEDRKGVGIFQRGAIPFLQRKTLLKIIWKPYIETEIMKMTRKEPSELTGQELLAEAKKMKSSALAHALIIGFMIGVVVYSIVKNTWGLLTLIPLFFIYKLTRNSDYNEELKKVLKERNLS